MELGDEPAAPFSVLDGAPARPCPTADEAAAYFAANCLRGDAQEFLDHYEAQGWVRGNGMPVSDWRAQARIWSRRQAQRDTERAARGEPPESQSTWKPAARSLSELDDEIARLESAVAGGA